jgi:hypothetical protein
VLKELALVAGLPHAIDRGVQGLRQGWPRERPQELLLATVCQKTHLVGEVSSYKDEGDVDGAALEEQLRGHKGRQIAAGLADAVRS